MSAQEEKAPKTVSRPSAKWKTWGEAFQAYRNLGHAIDIAAIKADEWERKEAKAKETKAPAGEGGGD